MLAIKLKRMTKIFSLTFIWLVLLASAYKDATAKCVKIDGIETDKFLQVKVYRLFSLPGSSQPVVILSDPMEKRGLLIWIGFTEADAIDSEMREIDHPRPLTHDLLENIIHETDLVIRQVSVTHIEKGIYFAKIFMERGGKLIEIDARPSDSIIMAMKFKVPILISDSLFREASIPLVEQQALEEEYGLTLQELTPSLAQAFSFKSTNGILASDVLKGSHADEDGIERGDILFEIEGQVIEDVESVRDALNSDRGSLLAKVFRKGHFITIILNQE